MATIMSHGVLVQPLARAFIERVIVHDGELITMITQPEVKAVIEENEVTTVIEEPEINTTIEENEVTATLDEDEIP